MAKLIASNCIFFLSSHYDNDNKNSLVSIISEFYLPEEIISTKTILIDECEKLGISNSIAKFKPTYKRGWNSESDQRHKRYLVLSEKLFLLLLLTIQRGYQLWTTTVKISITFSLSYRTCKSKLLTLGILLPELTKIRK